MSRINGHNNVVQKRDCELIAEQPLHEREIEADAHAVLMPLAVVRTRREKTSFIEVDIEVEFALAGRELRGELAFVVFVNRAIERAEVSLDCVVERIQLMFEHAAIGVIALDIAHRTGIGPHISRLDDEDIVRLNQAMLVFLGLAASPKTKRGT